MDTLIFQSAKLGDIPQILEELQRARTLLDEKAPVERVYGLSGGALTALAYALARSAQIHPRTWSAAGSAIDDFYAFLRHARSKHIRARNLNPWYGVYNLNPLRQWLEQRMLYYTQAALLAKNAPMRISDLPFPLYLCSMDHDGRFTAFGPPQSEFQFQYFTMQVGPPKDAPLVDALIAALSTMLSTEPVYIHNDWMRDCRPAFVDAGAIVADMQQSDPRSINRSTPYTPLRQWKQNWITSSFIMHSQNERNQALLAETYLELRTRHIDLLRQVEELDVEVKSNPDKSHESYTQSSIHPIPVLRHIDLPYIGSTEATTNMRQSVENKAALIARFEEILIGQFDGFPFDQPANVIYGAGGFSGILAGLTATRRVETGFAAGGGQIQQIYGVSAGVLNGFFHAVQVAARRHPDIYHPAAQHALQDLEDFVAKLTPGSIARYNKNPINFWQGWANLGPLEKFLHERLAAYTGSERPG